MPTTLFKLLNFPMSEAARRDLAPHISVELEVLPAEAGAEKAERRAVLHMHSPIKSDEQGTNYVLVFETRTKDGVDWTFGDPWYAAEMYELSPEDRLRLLDALQPLGFNAMTVMRLHCSLAFGLDMRRQIYEALADDGRVSKRRWPAVLQPLQRLAALAARVQRPHAPHGHLE